MKLKTSAIAVLAALPLMTAVASAAPTAAELQDRVYGSVFWEHYAPDNDKTKSLDWILMHPEFVLIPYQYPALRIHWIQ